MAARSNRRKISTTVAPETDAFLRGMIRRGRATSIADAVDRVVTGARRAESRRRLEEATAAYFESLSGEARKEENALGAALAHAAGKIDFDE